MSGTPLRIRDIYVGKPDAKDEMLYNEDQLIDAFVLPPQFDLSDILARHQYFIVGDKGSGKTALLRYLDHWFRTQDPDDPDHVTQTSFILFKSDYNELDRTRFDATRQRIVSALVKDIDESSEDMASFDQLDDFTGLWLWHLFRRIIEDNEACQRHLFFDDDDWKAFETAISSAMKKGQKKSLSSIFSSISFSFSQSVQDLAPVPSVTIDLGKGKGGTAQQVYLAFPEYIELACHLFSKTTRTDIPYYIFVDELEAYYGKKEIFVRDLNLIRDLLFAVKRINDALVRMDTPSRIFCSVRQEILNSIFNNSSVLPKELNRIIDGFSYHIQWSGKVAEGFKHPVLQILLRRIEVSEQNAGLPPRDRQELIDAWFPQSDPNEKSLAAYILDHSWHKPRDIVRLLNDLQACNDDHFSIACLQNVLGDYSRHSLVELQEELRAVYDTAQIEAILQVLRGAPDKFSAEELQERAAGIAPGSPLDRNVQDTLSVLYRQGFVGNITFEPLRYRLQCRGASDPIFSDDWLFFIHAGLQHALATVPRKRDALPSAFPDFNDDSELEDPALQALGRESTLRDLSRPPACIRGTIELDGQTFTGTLSFNYLNSLGLPKSDIDARALDGITAQVRVLALNPSSPDDRASYRVELLDPEGFVSTVRQATAQLLEPPKIGERYLLRDLALTNKGHVRGTFKIGLVGILNAQDLAVEGIDPAALVRSDAELSVTFLRSQTFQNGSTVHYLDLSDPQAVRDLLASSPSDPTA